MSRRIDASDLRPHVGFIEIRDDPPQAVARSWVLTDEQRQRVEEFLLNELGPAPIEMVAAVADVMRFGQQMLDRPRVDHDRWHVMMRLGYILALLATAIFWISAAAGASHNTALDTTARVGAGLLGLGCAYVLRPRKPKGGRR